MSEESGDKGRSWIAKKWAKWQKDGFRITSVVIRAAPSFRAGEQGTGKREQGTGNKAHSRVGF
jgi:hypothetical protein